MSPVQEQRNVVPLDQATPQTHPCVRARYGEKAWSTTGIYLGNGLVEPVPPMRCATAQALGLDGLLCQCGFEPYDELVALAHQGSATEAS